MSSTIMQEQTEYVRFWNEVLVPKFTRYKHVLVGGLTEHSDAIFPRLEVNRGEQVMDAGAGFGDTALMLARQVGPSGRVTAIDCCDGFLEHGRRDARAQGLDNVDFVVGDIQCHRFGPEYDLVFSRFGTMFFDNPVAALRNMRSALKPSGRFTMIVWCAIDDNPWLGAAKEVVSSHLPRPGEDAATCGPGPFSMSDPDLVTRQMTAAGFDDLTFERVDALVRMGSSIDDAIAFQLALGPAGEIYREAGPLAEERQAAIVEDLTTLLTPYAGPSGVYMGSSSWVVSARNSG